MSRYPSDRSRLLFSSYVMLSLDSNKFGVFLNLFLTVPFVAEPRFVENEWIGGASGRVKHRQLRHAIGTHVAIPEASTE